MRWVLALIVMAIGASLMAGEVRVRVPSGQTVTLRPTEGKPIEVALRDGTKLIGVDMRWYATAKAGDGPISEDDRSQIEQILTVPSFYDKLKILRLEGDNQHATALVELLRDREFHASGGDVIWRMELWYFEFENGGWAKVSQENKVLDRQRFAGEDALVKYVSIRRWVPKLGSLKQTAADQEVKLEPEDLIRSAALPDRSRQLK